MLFREAHIADIEQMHLVRTSVKENALSNPDLISFKDYETFILHRGKGWVCMVESNVVGFAIADIRDENVWALFVHPSFEGKGIGKALHDIMLNWYFSQSKDSIWLSTSPNTRAETFYRNAGWVESGTFGKNELKFEMQLDLWNELQKKN